MAVFFQGTTEAVPAVGDDSVTPGALPANQPPDMDRVVVIFGRYQIDILPPPA